MKSLRLMLCAMPLMLTGCSTMSSVNWSAANPWNWFGSSTKVSEQGVGELTASTPLQEQAIADALDGELSPAQRNENRERQRGALF